MWRARIAVPSPAIRGAVVQVRTLVAHPMHTGFVRGPDGEVVPRDILSRFTCHLDDELLCAVDLLPAVAANPYLAFSLRAARSGTLHFVWTDLAGQRLEEARAFTVTD